MNTVVEDLRRAVQEELDKVPEQQGSLTNMERLAQRIVDDAIGGDFDSIQFIKNLGVV